MSSIGTGYDLAASTFSPDGRIFQVEYAQKAVDNYGTVLAIRCKEGVVTAVDKVVSGKLEVPNSNPRIANINEYIGCTSAGIYPDCRSLLDYVQGEALNYLKEYREPIPLKKLATLKGAQIYLIEPSGLAYEYKAWAVGKHRQAAKTEIEKLKLDSLTINQLVQETVRILMTVRDESKDKNLRIEMGWVGHHTNGLHQPIPEDIVTSAERWAKRKLEEEDMED